MKKESRFVRELKGLFGDYWKNDALSRINEIEKDYETGELIIENGAAKWRTNGSYLMEDIMEVLLHSKYADLIDIDHHATMRDAQVTEEINNYKERMKNHVYTEEELYDMRSAFGVGTKVVNVFTGEEIIL